MRPAETPYYTIPACILANHTPGSPVQRIPAGINLNILLDENCDKALLLKQLAYLPNRFVISLPADFTTNQVLLTAWLPAIWIVCGMHQYGTEPVLLAILVQGAALTPVDTGLIEQYFASQETELPLMPVFCLGGTSVQQLSEACLLVNDTSLVATLPIAAPANDCPLLIAFTNAPETTGKFIEQVNDFALTAEQIYQASAEETLRARYIPQQRVAREEERWKNRLELYRQFLSLSKSVQEKEYYEVLNWYHKEYETLPLWYKRLGHIIKVLTGKRTMRSLFSDNVKKYKD
jgi:hypothetical protein